MKTLHAQEARKKIRQLIDDTSPVESPTAYYALFHPMDKSLLYTAEADDGQVQGFVGRFQTGADLFRPLVSLKCTEPLVAAQLLSQALVPGRPYILFASLNQLSMVGGSMHVENERILRIYTVDPRRFKTELNVMVEQRAAPDGSPRCVISLAGKEMAAAGVNWKSPGFAEIYAHVEAQARSRGWGQSVVACITQRLLNDGIRPVYLVEHNNAASRALIEKLGFYDTGSRQVYADAVYTGSPVD
jgi:ribosomal protein S18 acetylase RimI-like enzyme